MLQGFGTRSGKLVLLDGMAGSGTVSVGVVVSAQYQDGTNPKCGFRGFVISIGLTLLDSEKSVMINDMSSYNSAQQGQYSLSWFFRSRAP